MASFIYDAAKSKLKEIGAQRFLDSVHALEMFGREATITLLIYCEHIAEKEEISFVDAIFKLANLSIVDITVILKQIKDNAH